MCSVEEDNRELGTRISTLISYNDTMISFSLRFIKIYSPFSVFFLIFHLMITISSKISNKCIKAISNEIYLDYIQYALYICNS